MLKRAGYVVGLLFVLLIGAALATFVLKGIHLEHQTSGDISYVELSSLLLTGMGIILAALGLLLGVLAIVGWASFQSLISDSVERFLHREFAEGSDRHKRLVNEIKEAVLRESLEGVQGNKPVERDGSTENEEDEQR